jgi:hypothetical protein
LSAQGPVALEQSFQEFMYLDSTLPTDFVSDWEAGGHSLEETEEEIERLRKVECLD